MTRTLHTKPYAKLVEILVEARRAHGLTQQQVAARLGKPQSYVAKIERRERRLDVIEFIALAHALNSDPADLFSEITVALKES